VSCDTLPGQRLRLDADRISGLTAGSLVPLWSDLSGRGNHMSQSTAAFQPTWQPGTWNGHATVRFGANGSSALTRATSILTGNSPRTVMLVASRTVGGSGQAYLDLGSTSAGPGAAYLFSPEYSLRFQNGNALWSPGAPVNTPVVLSLVQDGTTASSMGLYENGQPKLRTGVANVALNTNGGTTIGHQTTTDFANRTWALRGDIGTVLVFDRVLSSAERCACERDLARKYGLPTPPCNV
jgi:hypothetical protein